MSWREESPNCARTHASFRLRGDALDPDTATRGLGLQPTLARTKDQQIGADPAGKPRRQRTGVWALSTENVISSRSLERHLLYLLDALEPSTAALRDLVRAGDLRADFFCYWVSATGHGGPEFSPQVLARVSAIDASLGIDFYGSDDESS